MTTPQFNDTLAVHRYGRRLTEVGFDVDRSVAVGSNFMVGNGKLGYRGTSPEQGAADFVALVVADTYDCADGRWRELATAPNPLFVGVMVDGRRLDLAAALSVATSLDLDRGCFVQTVVHRLDDGASITIEVERTASYADLDLLAQRVVVTGDIGTRVLSIDAGVDRELWSLNGTHLPSIDVERGERTITASGTTVESGTEIVVAAIVATTGAVSPVAAPGRSGTNRFESATWDGAPVVVDSIASVVASTEHDRPRERAETAVIRAANAGYDATVAASVQDWTRFWVDNDVSIGGSPLDDAALRFSSYHNRICTPAHTDRLPLGARGLSCQAYQGSAFWDQEIYNLPAFLFTEPEIARSLLVYRHRTLDGARRKAARLGYDGAYYAWISGETGDELCPDVFFTDVLTGREIRNHFNVWQMHVAPDVVTSIARYVGVTNDIDFLVDHGAEIAFEVARFLRSFVRYDDWKGTYHCVRLLGPDEWHENVDDNAFTNYQAHAAIGFAIDTYEQLGRTHPVPFDSLVERLGLTDDEVDRWRHVRDHLVLPAPDAGTRLVEQFDGFFDLEDISPADLAARLIDPSEYWGWPNGIAVRTQVSKQADVAMLMWLHERRFDDAVAAANYDYYEPRCSHNSSLSHAAYGMVAARLGRAHTALQHFRATAAVDLLNTNHAVVAGTFIGGVHTAACGGTVQLAVHGLGGLGADADELLVEPALPDAWTEMIYPVRWRGQRLRVHVSAAEIVVWSNPANDQAVSVRTPAGNSVVDPGTSSSFASRS